MSWIDDLHYTPALRWKKGEMDALRSLDQATKDRVLPHVILPSVDAKDVETGQRISRDDFSKVQVGRLQTYWASRVCLLDFRYLRLDAEDIGSDAARVSDLLVMSRTFGCKLVPVADLRTDDYRLRAFAAHIAKTRLGAAIRVDLSDLHDGLDEALKVVLAGLGVGAIDCVLVIDLSGAAIPNIEAFARFESEWITRLRQLGLWRRIVVEASSYPTANPAPKNGKIVVPRHEWSTWQHVIKDDPNVIDIASFGDFGADHGHINFGGGGIPIPHLRYAASGTWVVVRGGQRIEGHDGTIHTVARRLVESGLFLGPGYSAGDEFVSSCARREASGNPSTWRFANMAHHLTLVAADSAGLAGKPFERVTRAPPQTQLLLLEEARERR